MIRRPPRSTRTTHSFPTRRSSDLGVTKTSFAGGKASIVQAGDAADAEDSVRGNLNATGLNGAEVTDCRVRRSEEHTSELQSLMRISYAVFCLKKKNKQNNYINI